MSITPKLGALAVPIDSVAPYPGNPRQGDIGAISESLERFGQTKPIVVQASSGLVVAGNHIWRAAKALGWKDIAVNVVDMDDPTAKAYLIADNRTQELGSYDTDALTGILTELAQDDNLLATGYDGDDVDAMLKLLDSPLTPTERGGRRKATVCDFCGEPGLRLQLKLSWLENDGTEHNRGAGSVVMCENDWLRVAQPNMHHPVDSFEQLRRPEPEEEGLP